MKINGPGAALTFHLELFEKVDRSWSQLRNNSAIHTQVLRPTTLQRARLMTAIRPVEGASVCQFRDRPLEAFDSENFMRTMGLLRIERDLLNEGETHYISMHVSRSITDAAELIEPEPLFETDLPCKSGLIVLENVITHQDVHPDTGEQVPGLDMPIRAIGWKVSTVKGRDGKEYPGIEYALYATSEDWERVYVPALARTTGQVIDVTDDEFTGARELGIWMSDFSGWAFGVPWDDQLYTRQVSTVRRWLLTYFRWCWQRIIVPANHPTNRTQRRQMMRAGRPQDGYIKVVRLRREQEALDRGEKEYVGFHSHQFIVRGHWRRQWYRSLGPARLEDGSFNHDSHRLVWVEPHFKGNPTGPLVVGHNVTAAVR